MYKMYEANHVQEKRVEWKQAIVPTDNQYPTIVDILEAANKEFPGISLDNLRLSSTIHYDGTYHLSAIVLGVK